jgi:hypothetical protein
MGKAKAGDKRLGNQFWLVRSTHGRKPIFKRADKMWRCACEYFQWVEENPLIEKKLVSFQGASVLEDVPHMRAMTINALCRFMDISEDTFATYGKKKDFIGVVNEIRQVIYDQKFTGASAGFLNSNIIARDLGLKDKSDVEITERLLVKISRKRFDGSEGEHDETE